MVLFSVLVTAAFAVIIASVYDNLAIGIGLVIGALWSVGRDESAKKEQKTISLTTALLVLIGFSCLTKGSDEV